MKSGVVALVAVFTVVAFGVGGIGGYWFAHRGAAAPAHEPAGGPPAAAPADTAKGAGKERKLLYYRNPMGLPDTSPVPKKDPMGMDYIPVYEGEGAAPSPGGGLAIATDRVQKLGVRTEPVTRRTLQSLIRASGRIEVDERRTVGVTPKIEGYIERLHVNATGQPVARGQPLFEIYSPELVAVQHEYQIAQDGVAKMHNAGPEGEAGMRRLADASLARLRAFGVGEEQIAELARGGAARRTLTFRAPAGGVVLEKKAVEGMRIMPGDILFQIGDLATVWLIADVNEQDIGLLRSGNTATVRINAFPDRSFTGTIGYIYPTLRPETRTASVRVELANAGQRLKPGMYAQVNIAAPGRSRALSIPLSAVIDSGARRVVLVQHDAGRFEPREVELGFRSDEYVEVVKGLEQGEVVVTSANFLIDAESNLRAALQAFTTPSSPDAAAAEGAGRGATPKTVGHAGEGTVDAIDAGSGTLTITHGPIATLKWPAMTMDFTAANPSLVAGLAHGMPIRFEFVERKPGEWVVTRITRRGAAAGPASTSAPPPR